MGEPSHIDGLNQYVDDVLTGRIPAYKWVKLACERHLRDMESSKRDDFPYVFNEGKVKKICGFMELLPHVKGKWAADPKHKTIKLELWQKFILGSIFGWVKKTDGKRRFQKARIYVPRKNGKSIIGAGSGLYMIGLDGEHGAEIYSGATSEKQAWEVFSPARQMAIKHQRMAEALGITVNAQSLVRLSLYSGV